MVNVQDQSHTPDASRMDAEIGLQDGEWDPTAVPQLNLTELADAMGPQHAGGNQSYIAQADGTGFPDYMDHRRDE
jgi:hypothetical protein